MYIIVKNVYGDRENLCVCENIQDAETYIKDRISESDKDWTLKTKSCDYICYTCKNVLIETDEVPMYGKKQIWYKLNYFNQMSTYYKTYQEAINNLKQTLPNYEKYKVNDNEFVVNGKKITITKTEEPIIEF